MKVNVPRLFLTRYVLSAALTLLGSQATAQNLVQDGGFENPVIPVSANPPWLGFGTGSMGAWTVTQNATMVGIYPKDTWPGGNTTEGNQAFTSGVAGSGTGNMIQQTLPTAAGCTYELTFDWGSEYDWGTYSQVTIGDLDEILLDQPFDQTNTQSPNRPWIQYSASFSFVAEGNDVLTFVDLSTTNNPGPYSGVAGLCLDNVSVQPIASPECPQAAVAFRNAGSNPASYVASPIVIGATFTATVDNVLAGKLSSLLIALDTPFSLVLSGGQTLLCIDQASGELFTGAGLPPTSSLGGVDSYVVPVPNDPMLFDLVLYSQAIQFGVFPPFVLSNAQDLTVGSF